MKPIAMTLTADRLEIERPPFPRLSLFRAGQEENEWWAMTSNEIMWYRHRYSLKECSVAIERGRE